MEDLLKTEDLFKWFPIRGGLLSRTKAYVRAVDGVSLTVRKGETFGLVGESGCGKTTLGRTIMRLTEPSRGSISFEGHDISKLRGRRLKLVRRRMQIVFQDPYASLDPRQSIRSALEEPMKIHHTVSSKTEANREAENLIEKVGLNPDHLARFPHEFSGGQRQRIAIAIALAVKPTFIVLDEPTSSLDVSVQAQILELLKNLQKDMGLTYVFISHNLAVIRQMCARTAVMYLGRIVEYRGHPETLRKPQAPLHTCPALLSPRSRPSQTKTTRNTPRRRTKPRSHPRGLQVQASMRLRNRKMCNRNSTNGRS